MDALTKPKGKYLYKYSGEKGITYLETILLKNELFFPRPSQLNDPAEGRPMLSKPSRNRLITYLTNFYISSRPNLSDQEKIYHFEQIAATVDKFGIDLLHKEMSQILHEQLDNNHRVYSLSKRWNNMNLWAMYADNHKGYCIEYLNDGVFRSAYEVKYADTINAIDISNKETLNALFFFHKKQDWIGEEEVRIVTPSTVKMPLEIEPELVVSVIIGKNMTKANEELIKDWCSKRALAVKLYRAEYDVLSNELIRKEI